MTDKHFTAALIDPTVISCLEYDFLGINSVALPALYNLLEREGTALLDCNVSHQKIKSGISQSALIDELHELCSFCDDLDILKKLGTEVENAVNTVKNIDLHRQFTEKFEQLYANATIMPACSNSEFIAMYYANLPPFDKVDDDFDLADAFVLSTFIDYVNSHADERFLVVSCNENWRRILCAFDNVKVVFSAEDVTEKWLPERDMARQLYNRLKSKIRDQIEQLLLKHTYVVTNDCDEVLSEANVDSISVNNYFVSPLQVTNNVAVYRMLVDLDVYGTYQRSYCKYECDRLESFSVGSAAVDLEVEITFNDEDIAKTAQVATIKVTDRGAIAVRVSSCDDDCD